MTAHYATGPMRQSLQLQKGTMARKARAPSEYWQLTEQYRAYLDAVEALGAVTNGLRDHRPAASCEI